MKSSTALSSTPCPVARTVDLIGDRWSLLIVRDAFDGMRRFSDFQRSLGVARNILTDRLYRLVEAGILAREDAPDGSAYQHYVLTPQGQSLFPVVVALRQWGSSICLRRVSRTHSLLTGEQENRCCRSGCRGRTAWRYHRRIPKCGK